MNEVLIVNESDLSEDESIAEILHTIYKFALNVPEPSSQCDSNENGIFMTNEQPVSGRPTWRSIDMEIVSTSRTQPNVLFKLKNQHMNRWNMAMSSDTLQLTAIFVHKNGRCKLEKAWFSRGDLYNY
jgi:hypothetical protein